MSILSKPYAKLVLSWPVYMFHHMPKCGGSSVVKELEQWFCINTDYFNRNEKKPDVLHDNKIEDKYTPIDLSTLSRNNCVCGHFGHPAYHINERYPQVFSSFLSSYRYRVFSFLRDPLEMRCSLYRHQLKSGQLQADNLNDAIHINNNYYARIFRVNENNYKEKLDQYYFIGLADDLQNSFDQLAHKLKKPILSLPTINTSQNTNLSTSNELTAKQISDFKAVNSIDYEIYDYVKQRLGC